MPEPPDAKEIGREKRNEYQRAYRRSHPEMMREINRRYYQAHKEKRDEYQRLYRKTHMEKQREAARRYYQAYIQRQKENRKKRKEQLLNMSDEEFLIWAGFREPAKISDEVKE